MPWTCKAHALKPSVAQESADLPDTRSSDRRSLQREMHVEKTKEFCTTSLCQRLLATVQSQTLLSASPTSRDAGTQAIYLLTISSCHPFSSFLGLSGLDSGRKPSVNAGCSKSSSFGPQELEPRLDELAEVGQIHKNHLLGRLFQHR